MVAADGKIYVDVDNRRGRRGRGRTEFKKLATNTLPDTLYASPAIADGRIYLRGYGFLWAIGAK